MLNGIGNGSASFPACPFPSPFGALRNCIVPAVLLLLAAAPDQATASGVRVVQTAEVAYQANAVVVLPVPAALRGKTLAFIYSGAGSGFHCDGSAHFVGHEVRAGKDGIPTSGNIVRIRQLTGSSVSLPVQLCPGSVGRTFRIDWDGTNHLTPDTLPGFDTSASNCYSHQQCRTTISIVDPTPGIPVVSISAGGAITEGGTATFSLTADPAPAAGIDVDVTVTDSGTFAAAGQAGARTVTIGTDGTGSLTVATQDDNVDEPAGTITAAIRSGSGYSPHGSDSTAAVRVSDNDDPPPGIPVISISAGGAVTEGGTATFSLTADPVPAAGIDVDVTVTDSGAFAAAGQAGARTVTIGTDGTGSLTVATEDDDIDEPAGTITAAIRSGSGYSPHNSDSTAAVRVNDNDDPPPDIPTDRPSSPGLSIADTRGTEGQPLLFRVMLDAARPNPVTVDWETREGTATGDVDYVGGNGQLTFPPGDTVRTISIPTIDDDHHDDGETFSVMLSNASGADIADGTATGTISNQDLLPGNWIGRFGQAVGEQVVQAVRARMPPSLSPGFTGRIDGHFIGSDRKAGYRWEGDWDRDPEVVPVRVPSDMSFRLTRGDADGEGMVSVWWRGSVSGFRDAEVLDGKSTTFMLGIDRRTGRRLTGLAFGRSSGEGSWYGADDRMGTASMSLTGIYPYLGWSVPERLSLWGAAGYGSGELELVTPGEETYSTDVSLLMAAAGMRSELMQGGRGPAVAVLADGLFTGMRSDAVPGLGASDGKRLRLRLGLESRWDFALEDGALAPRAGGFPASRWRRRGGGPRRRGRCRCGLEEWRRHADP